jgi:cytochrome c553
MNSLQRIATRIVVVVLSSLVVVMVGSAAHAAGNVKAGHQKARTCESCHGLDGRSKMPEVPNLAGQIESYLVVQLQAFKAGKRKNEQMSVIVQGLSPQDIEDLAAYYSAIEVTVGKVAGE